MLIIFLPDVNYEMSFFEGSLPTDGVFPTFTEPLWDISTNANAPLGWGVISSTLVYMFDSSGIGHRISFDGATWSSMATAVNPTVTATVRVAGSIKQLWGIDCSTLTATVFNSNDDGSQFAFPQTRMTFANEYASDMTFIKTILTCSDSLKNQDETDVDCGGVCGNNCANSLTCKVHGDCSSGFCNSNKVCGKY